MDPFTTVSTQVCLMMGGLTRRLNLEDGQLMTYTMISITSLSSSNPKASPPHLMCDIGNSIKAVSSPSTLFITRFREESNCFWWIWTTQAPLKIRVHMWLTFHERLLMVDNLKKKWYSYYYTFLTLWGASGDCCSCISSLAFHFGVVGARARSIDSSLLASFYCASLGWLEAIQHFTLWSQSMGLCGQCNCVGSVVWAEQMSLSSKLLIGGGT